MVLRKTLQTVLLSTLVISVPVSVGAELRAKKDVEKQEDGSVLAADGIPKRTPVDLESVKEDLESSISKREDEGVLDAPVLNVVEEDPDAFLMEIPDDDIVIETGKVESNPANAYGPFELYGPPEPIYASYDRGNDASRAALKWFVDGKPIDVLVPVLTVLEQADKQGLNPQDYYLADLVERFLKQDYSAETNKLVNRALRRYIIDMKIGRNAPREYDPEQFRIYEKLNSRRLLRELYVAPNPVAYMATLEPKLIEYQGLKRSLAFYKRVAKAGGFTSVPVGENVGLGSVDPQIPYMRKRLFEGGFLNEDNGSNRYDPELQEAVNAFQSRFGLVPDGIVGPSSRRAMNIPAKRLARMVELNMERMRWLPDEFGERYVRVNIASFYAEVVENGDLKQKMKVIVGQPHKNTPYISSEIYEVMFHPYWHVPPKLMEETYLPKVQASEAFAKGQGFELFEVLENGGWKKADPAAVDPEKKYILRQKPNKYNALGRVRFNIKHSTDIYMHGTAHPELFKKHNRAISSGCVRLEDPLEMAQFLLAEQSDYDRQNVENLYNNESRFESGRIRSTVITLEKPVPVYITYWTAWVNEDGYTHFRGDLYGRDTILEEALGLIDN